MTSPAFQKVVILGSGSWGTALAVLSERMGAEVTIVGRSQETLDDINQDHQNTEYLPGVHLSERITASSELSVCQEADLILFVIPTSATRNVAEKLNQSGIRKKTVLLSCSKGIERDTSKRMSQIIAETFPENPIAVMSGPNHAEEIARGLPAAATIACPSADTCSRLQHFYNSERFRIYTSHDTAGVELGGALKNIFAIAAGAASGMKLGDNAVAALATRSLREMIRLGTALGGESETFVGLSGLGDLMTTCFSPHSRNFRVGVGLAEGHKLKQVTERLGMVAEGVPNTLSIHQAARSHGVRTPIVDIVYSMLYEDVAPHLALEKLYDLTPRQELE